MTEPRIPPGTRKDVGPINWTIARGLGLATRGGPPNVFTTLGRHRGLFRRWLRFAGGLMPFGKLPRKDTELVILRVAHNCGSEYERHQHERLGRRVGLTKEEIAAVRDADHRWPERQDLLLRATDELHAARDITDGTWAGLERHLSERERIELCMLVGHYEMLAMTLNALRVQVEVREGARHHS